MEGAWWGGTSRDMPLRPLLVVVSLLGSADAAGPFAAFGSAVCRKLFIDHIDCATYTTEASGELHQVVVDHANTFDGGDVATADRVLCEKVSAAINQTLSGADYDSMLADAVAAAAFCDEYFAPEYRFTHSSNAYGQIKDAALLNR